MFDTNNLAVQARMDCRRTIDITVVIVALVIGLYTMYRTAHPGFADPLSVNLICGDDCGSEEKRKATDMWAVSHFVMHFGLGCVCPSGFKRAMLYGLIWEGAEYSVDVYRTRAAKAAGKVPPPTISKATDIIFNMSGFLCGNALSALMNS